jgi:hypothetical protein
MRLFSSSINRNGCAVATCNRAPAKNQPQTTTKKPKTGPFSSGFGGCLAQLKSPFLLLLLLLNLIMLCAFSALRIRHRNRTHFCTIFANLRHPKMTGTSYTFHASIIDFRNSLRRRFRFAASSQRCCKGSYTSRLRAFSSPDAMTLNRPRPETLCRLFLKSSLCSRLTLNT